jgi:O-succinylbenzoic acid--CoA ligase
MVNFDFIHPGFRLDGQSFSGKSGLTDYVSFHYPAHADFLNDWFSDNDHITLQTSGSTGKPQKIVFPKEKLVRSALRTIRFFDLPPQTKALLNLPPVFVAGKMMWIRALTGGWQLTLKNPGGEIGKDEYFDFGAMVPKQIAKNIHRTGQIAKLLSGGAYPSAALLQNLKGKRNMIFQTYGMTETLTHVAVMPLTKSAASLLNIDFKPVYTAVEGVSFSIDRRSCLRVKDDYLEIELTTNDVVELIDEKTFIWRGRYDHVINSGGIKIFPEEVELKLAAFIDRRFIITSLPDEEWGEKTVLLIEGDAYPFDTAVFELAGLKFYEKPKEIRFIKKFPETASGKIRRGEAGKIIRKK